MGRLAPLMSSARHDWETPPVLFAALDAQFHFTLDVCALPRNAKCARYFTPADDGLTRSWRGETCWMNPPYGRAIGAWVARAHHETQHDENTCVVALLPARTDTRWWHEHVMAARDIYLLRGRLRFVGAASSAPFPSAIAVWTGAGSAPPRIRSLAGPPYQL